jgi:zinc protease
MSIADRVRTAPLACGARLHLLENHTNPTVDVVGLLEGGLFVEPPGMPGVADLTISMLDRGTRTREEREIAEALESNGAVLQYALGPETTVVAARCLSEDLTLLIGLLGETLREPSFPEAQLGLEREETLVALRESAFDASDQAYRRAAGLLLGERDPYARDPLGEEAVVTRLGRADLAAHHARSVCGERLRIAVVGDIDPAATVELFERSLTGLPRTGEAVRVTPRAAAPRERSATPERIAIPDKEQVEIVFALPGIARTAADFEAYGLANFVFGGSFISRLNLRLRDEAGITYGAHSQINSGREPGCWIAAAGVHPANVDRAIALALEEMRRMAESGITADELTLAQQHLTGTFPIRLETNRAIASVLIESERFDRGLDYVDRYPERIRALTVERVNAAARRLIDPARVVIAAAGTFAD